MDQNAVPGAAPPDVAKDVARLCDVLVHPNRCGYAANVRVTTGRDSTRDGIMTGLDWLRDRLRADPSGDLQQLATALRHVRNLAATIGTDVAAVRRSVFLPIARRSTPAPRSLPRA